MNALEARLLEQLQKLPPGRIAEIIDFAAFLAAREERDAAARRLGQSMSKLHSLDLPPSDDEIERAVQESRRARRRDVGGLGSQEPSDPQPAG